MIAITVMGAIWGLVGMVIGVPLFATAVELTNEYLDTRLKKKGLPTETESYYGAQTKEKISPERRRRPAKRKNNAKERKRAHLRAGSENDQVKLYLLAQKHELLTSPTEEALSKFREEYLALRTSARHR
jgi:hypothetical protein